MAKILIHARQIHEQANLLQKELEKSGHEVEISTASHPLRLVLQRYDILHLLSETLPLNLKDYILVLSAKALGLPVIVSVYSEIQSEPRVQLQLKSFDALTIQQIKELKKVRDFKGQKMLLPALPAVDNIKPSSTTSAYLDSAILIPVAKSFSELPRDGFKCSVYIDASALAQENKVSTARRNWAQFIKKNPNYQNAILVLNAENILRLNTDFRLAVFLGNVQANSFSMGKYLELALQNNWLPVLTEHQASGFSEFWRHGYNCWILNHRYTFTEKYEPSEIESILETLPTVQHKKSEFYKLIEPKMNELSRLYFKLIMQKTSLLESPPAKMGT